MSEFGDLIEIVGAFAAVEDEHLEAGSELFGFGGPVRDDRGGCDDERGFARGFLVERGKVGEGLQGFAEAHVIGEDAVQAVVGEKLEPAETIELIGPELGPDGGGKLGGRQAADVAQIAAEFRQRLGGFGTFDGQRVGHASGAEPVEPDGPIAAGVAVEQVADLLDHFEETFGGEADVAVRRLVAGQQQGFRDLFRIGETQVPILGDGAGDLRDQADGFAVELGGDIKAEPVDAVITIRLDGGEKLADVVDGEVEFGVGFDGPALGFEGLAFGTVEKLQPVGDAGGRVLEDDRVAVLVVEFLRGQDFVQRGEAVGVEFAGEHGFRVAVAFKHDALFAVEPSGGGRLVVGEGKQRLAAGVLEFQHATDVAFLIDSDQHVGDVEDGRGGHTGEAAGGFFGGKWQRAVQ